MVLLPKPTSIIDLGEGGEFDDDDDDDGLNAAIDDLEETASAAARVSDGEVRRISMKPVELLVPALKSKATSRVSCAAACRWAWIF
jgi:hypothetical protein